MKYQVKILPPSPDALFAQREDGLTHSAFSLELSLYTALRDGDEAALRRAMDRYFAAGFVIGRMSADSLRQMKFWAVSVVAIAIHYAILGGLDETDAYNLSDEYIRHIDGLFSIDQCVEYLSSRAIELVRAVAASKKEHTLSPKIKACVHYIHIHLHDRLTVGALAACPTCSARKPASPSAATSRSRSWPPLCLCSPPECPTARSHTACPFAANPTSSNASKNATAPPPPPTRGHIGDEGAFSGRHFGGLRHLEIPHFAGYRFEGFLCIILPEINTQEVNNHGIFSRQQGKGYSEESGSGSYSG